MIDHNLGVITIAVDATAIFTLRPGEDEVIAAESAVCCLKHLCQRVHTAVIEQKTRTRCSTYSVVSQPSYKVEKEKAAKENAPLSPLVGMRRLFVLSFHL